MLDEVQALPNNECGRRSREALRLPFDDAMGFSPTLGSGGADGSIITFADTELQFVANGDVYIRDIVDALTPLVSQSNVTPGDLINFTTSVAMTNCPGGLLLTFFTGRPAPTEPAPDGLIPLITGTHRFYCIICLLLNST